MYVCIISQFKYNNFEHSKHLKMLWFDLNNRKYVWQIMNIFLFSHLNCLAFFLNYFPILFYIVKFVKWFLFLQTLFNPNLLYKLPELLWNNLLTKNTGNRTVIVSKGVHLNAAQLKVLWYIAAIKVPWDLMGF